MNKPTVKFYDTLAPTKPNQALARRLYEHQTGERAEEAVFIFDHTVPIARMSRVWGYVGPSGSLLFLDPTP